jgi:hypothetical protein
MPWEYIIPLAVTAVVVLAMVLLARRGLGT